MGFQKFEGCQKPSKEKEERSAWKNWRKKHSIANFLILLQQGRGHGQAGFTSYRKYLPLEPFLSLKVYLVGIIPVCQHIIWTHVWPPIIWTHASILYEHEHMYDLLSISVVLFAPCAENIGDILRFRV